MKTIARITLAATLGIAASGTPIFAQASAPVLRIASVAPITAPAPTTYDAAAVQARLQKAGDLLLEGHVSAARREYADIIELQRSHNVLPTEAMWQLAGLYNTEGSWKRTAAVLNELAEDAERYGNPQVQAEALLEATVLYDKARMPQEALACAKRLDSLMGSPFVTEELRQEVQRRIIR